MDTNIENIWGEKRKSVRGQTPSYHCMYTYSTCTHSTDQILLFNFYSFENPGKLDESFYKCIILEFLNAIFE